MPEDQPQPQPQSQPQALDRDSRNARVMSRLKDSLLSQLDPSRSLPLLTADHSSFIQSRLQNLFPSFHTPTHPPYALMIRKAITELNDGRGMTEEAISEFIRREYEDLPWAHTKILDFHLNKLCDVGELSFTEDGRYALPVVGGEETEKQCKGRRKRKCDQGDGERVGTVDSAGSDELNRVVEEGPPSNESQIQKEGTVDCEQGSPDCIISTTSPEMELSSPTQLQPQISSDIDLGGVSKMTVSLTCVNVDDDDDDDELPQHYNQGVPEGNLDENPMLRCLKQKKPKGPRGRPRKTKIVANSPEESSFNKQGSIASDKVKQGRGRPRKVNQDTEQCIIEQSQLKDQAKPSVRGRGRRKGRGGGRSGGRGRGEGVNQDTEQWKEESHPDQAKPNGRGGNRGRGQGVSQDTEQCEEQSHPEDQAKPRGRSRGGGRGRGRSGSRHRGRPVVRKDLLK